MGNGKIDDFCAWWRSLTPTDLPQPAATAIEERRHQHYYVFANELKRRWSDCAAAFQALYASDKARVVSVVESASEELTTWFDDLAKPTLVRILKELRSKDDPLLQRLGALDGPFGRRAVDWLDKLRSSAESAAKNLLECPPYLSLGAQARRPETRLERSTGVWATHDVLHNWPWRDFVVVRDSLLELRDFGSDYPRWMELLTAHCEGPWLEVLRKIPDSSVSVQAEVAGSSWTAVHVLELLLCANQGMLSWDAYHWAQQLTALFQPWYERLGGVSGRMRDEYGVLSIHPIRSMNSAFAEQDPGVTNFASSDIRYPTLFLRFLVDRIVAAADSASRRADQLSKPGDRLGSRIKSPAVSDCVISAFWSERWYVAEVGTKNAPAQRTISRLPKSVVRVLQSLGELPRGQDEPPISLKHDDRTRFRAWFHGVFNVAEKGDPIPKSSGGFFAGWHTRKPRRV